MVKSGKRFKFVSDRARDSWNMRVVETTELAMQSIKVSGVIGFRDGTLIRDISNHRIYLISDYKRRHVTSPDVLSEMGFRVRDIVLVSHREASVHQDGEMLNA